MSKKKTTLISIIILAVAGIVTTIIFLTEPEAQRTGATKETAMLVDVVPVEKGDFNPVVIATGTVQPSKEIMLSPRVSGEITERSDGFVPGGTVRKGEILLQIDPADYYNTLELRKSDLSQALADLEIEQGRQDVAMKDYQLIEEELSKENMQLVLREPQLNAVKAQVEAARAAVSQAKLNLQRTTIRAPFDAHILTRNVNVGSQVNTNTNLGRLVGIDTYWVIVNVPLSKISRIRLPSEGEKYGSEVTIEDRKAWPEGESRTGYVYKLIGALESQTRMARVLVEVPDPMSLETDAPPMVINSFVEASIEAEEFTDVIRLSRDYLREDETVWVMEDEKLQILEVDVVFTDARYAYITGGISENARVITTNLATVTEGAPVRTSETSMNENSDTASLTADRRQKYSIQ